MSCDQRNSNHDYGKTDFEYRKLICMAVSALTGLAYPGVAVAQVQDLYRINDGRFADPNPEQGEHFRRSDKSESARWQR